MVVGTRVVLEEYGRRIDGKKRYLCDFIHLTPVFPLINRAINASYALFLIYDSRNT